MFVLALTSNGVSQRLLIYSRMSDALARAADSLGYSVAWAAEAYGSDSPTVLAWLAVRLLRAVVNEATAPRWLTPP